MARVGVTATAVRIIKGNPNALAVNVGRASMYVGPAGVTVTTGLEVEPTASINLPAGAGAGDDLWAVTAPGTSTVVDVAGGAESYARAGANQTVGSGDLVTLDGTGSTGPLSWSQVAGPAVTLSSTTATLPTFTAPTGPTTLTFRLTAAGGEMAATTVTVSPPVPTRAEALEAILAATTRWRLTVDIYENDATTLWLGSVPVVDGTVTGSFDTTGRRRILDATLQNIDGALDHHPNGFWYDKVLKVYRGIELGGGRVFTEQVGEFVLPTTSQRHHPKAVSVRAEDYAATLSGASKFTTATTFTAGNSVEAVIKAIASAGGITKFNLAATNEWLERDFAFDVGTERWTAITEIATAYGLDAYFDARGYLVLDEQTDPAATAPLFTFGIGTLANIEKSQSPARIYNTVLVTGESAGSDPVYGTARNTAAGSPTRIKVAGEPGGLPERVYQFTSSFITTTAQAQRVARNMLSVHALEEFNISLESLVIPWLAPGDIIGFEDPDPAPGDPTTYLLTELTIPLRPGPMTSTGKRVTIVGD